VGISAASFSAGVTVSGDGSTAAFATDDGTIVAGDVGGLIDVFLVAAP
jgi:hypothetical protein